MPFTYRNLIKIAVMFLIMLSMTGCASTQAEPNGAMELLAINVRKADCLLLRYDGHCYMIDTGTPESWGSVSATLKAENITHLDGVILTHTDGDHAGGLMALAQSDVQVDAWYASRYYADVKSSKHPLKLAAALRGEQVTWIKAGDSLPFGSGSLTVLGPMKDSEIENCNSVVLLAKGAGGSMLLAGDMEFPEENDLMDAGVLERCTVLKVANHGEKDATSESMVHVVRPQIALISTNSDDEPDTPSNRVLKLLKKAGAQMILTQNGEAGAKVVIRNGQAQASFVQWPAWPDKIETVQLTAKENEQFTTTVTNFGTVDVDVSGWFICSKRGGEIFVFPKGSIIPAAASVTISCLSSDHAGDYVWQDTKVWHPSKDDSGLFYDVYGRLINQLD